MNKIKFNQPIYLIFLLFYISLIFGFIVGEDALGGAEHDYVKIFKRIKIISEDPFYYFINYDELKLRHSPIFQFYRSFFYILLNNDIFFQVFNLHLNMLIIFIFYNTLKLRFGSFNKQYLFAISCLILILPSFRSNTIWPDSFICGFIFFILAIYFLMKLIKKKDLSEKFDYAKKNVIFLCIASYISPNFAPFSIFFLFIFYDYFGLSKKLIKLILLNFICSIPLLLYVFVLDVNFLDLDGSRWVKDQTFFSLKNLSNKLILLPTIFFIFLFPIIILEIKTVDQKLIKFCKSNLILKIFIIISPLLVYKHFSYLKISEALSGGGIIFNILKYFNNNILILALFSSITIFFIILFVVENKNNLVFLICLVLTNPQLTVYTMYFELILFTSVFLLFKYEILKKSLFNMRYVQFLYIYYIGFLSLYFFKNDFYNFMNNF